jgi:hypothetical protein
MLDWSETRAHTEDMNFSHDFATTLATIAAKAAASWPITAEQAVDLAWFSVNSVGDASIDDADLARHFDAWWSATYIK